MNGIISRLVTEGSIFDKAVFVMISGLIGVFAVLAVFFFLIILLEKAFRPKQEKQQTT